MTNLSPSSNLTERDLARGRNIRLGAISAPLVLTILPALLFTILTIVFSGAPIFAVSTLVLGVIATILGLVIGLSISGYLFFKYQNWTSDMRERIAANGISANELDWFRKEMKPGEKRALKQLAAKDLLLEDAYRETLASRITASRIVKISRKELGAAKRREAKLRSLKAVNNKNFLGQLAEDRERIEEINSEAKLMLAEAESRLQMIEAAAARGVGFSDTEVALKKLTARAAQLPLALEAARMNKEAIAELEAEGTLPDDDELTEAAQ